MDVDHLRAAAEEDSHCLAAAAFHELAIFRAHRQCITCRICANKSFRDTVLCSLPPLSSAVWLPKFNFCGRALYAHAHGFWSSSYKFAYSLKVYPLIDDKAHEHFTVTSTDTMLRTQSKNTQK